MDTQPSASPIIEKTSSTKPTHHHRWLWWLIGVVVVLLVIIGGIGIVQVPVVSAVLGVAKPVDLGVVASEQALTSLEQKIPVKVVGNPTDFVAGGNETYTGSISVDTTTTSEEVTSFLQLFPRGNNSVFKDTQVKKVEGGVEISTMLEKYVHAPVYVRVNISKLTNKSVTLDIQSAKLGRIPVPAKYLQQAEEYIQDLVNDRIAQVDGFTIDTLQYHDGYTTFKGTYPAEVKSAAGRWIELY
ncbi:MAG: hypothetical protein WCV85_06450 [Patescibacteria group bacterium]